jgi:3-oxoacyl-[acyl-carrier-protein] synthase-3
MVLGELGIPACEGVSTSGICISGMTSFKYAFMNVATGCSKNAVATGSELASSYTRASYLEPQIYHDPDLEKKPILGFDADFLRWMLSDGSGAVFLSGGKNKNGMSLRIDWIENISYAGELETCMYGGGQKKEDGRVVSWRCLEDIDRKKNDSLLSIRQDIRLLGKEIVRTAMDLALVHCMEKYNLSPGDIDWFLPHYSSWYFRDKFYEGMKHIGFEIPYDKWFTNLSTTGNTGSAAIYIILEELFHSTQIKPGQKLLCFIPESGRFSHCYMMLTAV